MEAKKKVKPRGWRKLVLTKHTHTLAHTQTHSQAHKHTGVYTHSHTRMFTRSHTGTHAYINTKGDWVKHQHLSALLVPAGGWAVGSKS